MSETLHVAPDRPWKRRCLDVKDAVSGEWREVSPRSYSVNSSLAPTATPSPRPAALDSTTDSPSSGIYLDEGPQLALACSDINILDGCTHAQVVPGIAAKHSAQELEPVWWQVSRTSDETWDQDTIYYCRAVQVETCHEEYVRIRLNTMTFVGCFVYIAN
jgi:hypothetical protein